jgi:hypothetical protein
VGAETTSWQPDPYGLHELRFFSADGKPTLLVMDGGRTSYDRPPSSPPSPAPAAPTTSEPQPSAPEPSPSPRPPEVQPSESAPPSEPPQIPPPTGSAVDAHVDTRKEAGEALAAPAAPPDVLSDRPADPRPARRPAVPVLTNFAAYGPVVTYSEEPETLSHSRRIAYLVVFAALALSVLGLAYVHLKPSGGTPSAHAGGAATHSRSTAPKSVTTTTVALPTSLSPSADAAASALVSSWSTGNKQSALAVATPTAVATLFAAPYTSGLAIARGCSTEFSPIVCTFGPPGGASPSDAIYQVLVTQAAGGWYVSSVRIQG